MQAPLDCMQMSMLLSAVMVSLLSVTEADPGAQAPFSGPV